MGAISNSRMGRQTVSSLLDSDVIDGLFAETGLPPASIFRGRDIGPVVLGVSGGGDSMALAVIAQRWAERNNQRLLTVTVDHVLRPESGAEARLVGEWMADLGAEHRILTWEHPPLKTALQERARAARYRLIVSLCKDVGARWFLTAHTAEDQAETVAMRVLRQSGPDGLSGMARIRDYGDVVHGRPLLDCRRSMLRYVCTAAGAPWIDDPSNDDPAYTRVAIRRALSATSQPIRSGTGGQLESDVQAWRNSLNGQLCRLARSFGIARGRVDTAVLDALEAFADISPDGEAEIELDGFQALHSIVRDRLAARLLTSVGGRSAPLDAGSASRMGAALTSGSSKAPRAITLAGCYCRLAKGRHDGSFSGAPVLKIVREPGRTWRREPVRAGQTVTWDNRFAVGPTPTDGWLIPSGGLLEGGPGGSVCAGGSPAVSATLPVLADERGRLIAAPCRLLDRGGQETGWNDGRFGYFFDPAISPWRPSFGSARTVDVVGTR